MASTNPLDRIEPAIGWRVRSRRLRRHRPTAWSRKVCSGFRKRSCSNKKPERD